MLITVRHTLSLSLGPGVIRSAQHLLLTPQTGRTQAVREWSIDLPGIANAASFTDGFGNRALLVTQFRPEPELVVLVAGVVETTDRNGVVGRVAGEPPPALYRRPTPLAKAADAITARLSPKDGNSRITLLHELMARVAEVVGNVQAQSQSDDGQMQSQSQGETSGVPAADFAHAFIGTARALEIPARYVSGYVAEHGEEAYWHAWAEAWDDGLGWIAFDPALGYCPTDRHVRVAAGLDAAGTMAVRSVPTASAATTAMQVDGQ